MDDRLYFKMPCQWCGTISHDQIPTPAKDDSFIVNCNHCHKTIIEYHWHKHDDKGEIRE